MKNSLNYTDIKKVIAIDSFRKDELINLGKTAERNLFFLRLKMNKIHHSRIYLQSKFMLEEILKMVQKDIDLINKKLEQNNIKLRRLH